MSARTEKFEVELKNLADQGDELLTAMKYECFPREVEQQILKSCSGNEEGAREYISRLPKFSAAYQEWYSKSYAVVKQVLPHRISDFASFYEYPRPRKEITYQNYMIRDYLKGLQVKNGIRVVVEPQYAILEFEQQLNVLKAAQASLFSSLIDLKAVLQADLFDTEIESASALAKAGYRRAAGAICGVVIEKHLLHVCDAREITSRKKNPSISDLIQLLKDSGVIEIPQWRFIQHLADIRNVCDHAKGRDPTKEEIDDLVTGSQKVLKTVF